MKKNILFGILILALVGGAYAYYEYNKPVASIENKKADVVIDADDLLSAYESDENTANQLYTEKIIQVKGTISEITKDGTVDKVIIETTNPLAGVICEMENGQNFGALKTGDEIEIKGRCTGFLSDVVLVQSSIVK